jgi:hypothetical protein
MVSSLHLPAFASRQQEMHDIMIAVSIMPEGLLQVDDICVWAVITYGLGPLNECV